MSERPPPTSLEELLDRLEEPVVHQGEATVRSLMETVGQPSFGPLLVTIGLAGVTPISGVPTVPTLLAVCAALVAVQLVIGRKHFGCPGSCWSGRSPEAACAPPPASCASRPAWWTG
jgi:hypothetical protein